MNRVHNVASIRIWGTWAELKASWKQSVLRRWWKVGLWVEEVSRMPDGSEFQTAAAATLK